MTRSRPLLDFLMTSLCHFSLVPRIVQLSSKAPPTWDVQFTRSVNSYYDAQFQLMNNRCNSVIPHLEEYIELRRGLSGFGMALNLLELTENMTFPSMGIYRGEKMEHLKRLAIDIISCSLVRTRNLSSDSNH